MVFLSLKQFGEDGWHPYCPSPAGAHELAHAQKIPKRMDQPPARDACIRALTQFLCVLRCLLSSSCFHCLSLCSLHASSVCFSCFLHASIALRKGVHVVRSARYPPNVHSLHVCSNY
eukprot:1161897-Pelagomonas_calceolata.AAC.6